MSSTPNPVNPLDPAGLGVTPPPAVSTSGKEPQPFARPVAQPSAEQLQDEQQAFIPQTGTVSIGSADRPRTKSTITGYLYSGKNLVNERGQIVREPYDTVREAYTELRSIPSDEREALLKEMYQRGLYDKNLKPSATGLEQRDLRVMQDILLASNTYGYNWRTSLNFIRQENPVSSGSGRKLTSSVDLARALDQTALGALGRTLTPEERKQQIAYIQAQEAAGTTTSTSTLVSMAPSRVDPAEEQAYNFARVADLTASILGGS